MERGQTLGGMESHPARFRSKGILRQFRGQEETVITHYYTLGKCNALDFARKARVPGYRGETPVGTSPPGSAWPSVQRKEGGEQRGRKTSRPLPVCSIGKQKEDMPQGIPSFLFSASDGTTPRRRSGPALPRPAPHYNAPAAVARLRSLWSLVLTERNLGPSKCACGRGPRGHKVRPGLPAVSAVRTPGRAGVRACSAPRCGAP